LFDQRSGAEPALHKSAVVSQGMDSQALKLIAASDCSELS
jgi:hypothetical protein